MLLMNGVHRVLSIQHSCYQAGATFDVTQLELAIAFFIVHARYVLRFVDGSYIDC
eukprot:m.259115 g.259115  ORF g.259115 m.259115 type:complete len:55 (-) comp19659_c0_seq1:382-546(-)